MRILTEEAKLSKNYSFQSRKAYLRNLTSKPQDTYEQDKKKTKQKEKAVEKYK